MQVLALCSQTGILMLNLGQLHLKFLFFFFNAVSLVSLLSSALRWFHSLMCSSWSWSLQAGLYLKIRLRKMLLENG